MLRFHRSLTDETQVRSARSSTESVLGSTGNLAQRLEQAVFQVVIEGPVLNLVFVAIGTAVGIGATAIELMQSL